MRFPADMVELISKAKSLGIACNEHGGVSEGFDSCWGDTAYPPCGYLPWKALEVGNGDTYGFYWPIGREEGPPVVCTLMHDEWAVLPVASGLREFARLHVLRHSGSEEDPPEDEELNALIDEVEPRMDDLSSICERAKTEEEEEYGLPYWGAWNPEPLLEADAQSPHLLMLSGKAAIAQRRLELAEKHLLAALAVLPEYSEALGLLALVYRQMGQHADSAAMAMEAITSPHCFGVADRKRLSGWIRQMRDSTYTGNDPLWRMRGTLEFSQDGEGDADYSAFEPLVEAYHVAGLGQRAVRLRITVGEMMSRETAAFQERAGWSGGLWREVLRDDLKRAGIARVC